MYVSNFGSLWESLLQILKKIDKRKYYYMNAISGGIKGYLNLTTY